ncbi:endolytic transglycosylase MltG [Pseudomonadota bacterium]|nr:endolytic transglycosylase MltG [Pseudomonadota bacterium]
MSSKISNISLFILSIVISNIVLIGSSESFSHSRVNNDLEFYSVKEGASFHSIIEEFTLQPAQKFLLKVYLRVNNINIAQAGHYHIKNKSWKNFILSVNKGDVVIFQLEIPAGKNLFEINRILLESNLINDCYNFKCLDNRFNYVEGTLKPDTYFYKHSDSLSKILQRSQDDFFKLSLNLWEKKKSNLPIKTLSDALILASIVEKEAGNENEKSIIAGVFLHRLSIGMKLQADPTIIYGLMPDFNGDITKANLMDKNNPYNTYQILALPPTPISTISQSSLEAVILGMKNDYLYFVAKGDGTHKFSKTYKQHLEAVKKYQLN